MHIDAQNAINILPDISDASKQSQIETTLLNRIQETENRLSSERKKPDDSNVPLLLKGTKLVLLDSLNRKKEFDAEFKEFKSLAKIFYPDPKMAKAEITMLHARIFLSKGDRKSAINLLDGIKYSDFVAGPKTSVMLSQLGNLYRDLIDSPNNPCAKKFTKVALAAIRSLETEKPKPIQTIICMYQSIVDVTLENCPRDKTQAKDYCCKAIMCATAAKLKGLDRLGYEVLASLTYIMYSSTLHDKNAHEIDAIIFVGRLAETALNLGSQDLETAALYVIANYQYFNQNGIFIKNHINATHLKLCRKILKNKVPPAEYAKVTWLATYAEALRLDALNGSLDSTTLYYLKREMIALKAFGEGDGIAYASSQIAFVAELKLKGKHTEAIAEYASIDRAVSKKYGENIVTAFCKTKIKELMSLSKAGE
jgi:hypothetical protein